MEKFLTLLASGLSLGCVVALVALGVLVLYKATGVMNFAHGDLATLAAYLAVWMVGGVGLPQAAAYPLVVLTMIAAGGALRQLAFAPLRGKSFHVAIVVTLGVALVIRAVLALWQGPNVRSLPSPVGAGAFHPAGATLPYHALFVMVLSGSVMSISVLLFKRTRFGREVRALAADREMAMMSGVRVDLASNLAFALSAVLAGCAGLLVAPVAGVTLTLGFNVMLLGFAAGIFAGFDSLAAAATTGVGLGLLQQVVGGYVLTDYSAVLPFAVMFVAIVVRPGGFITTPQRVRV